MRAWLFVVGSIAMSVASCGSDSSPAPAGAASSTSGGSSGTTSSGGSSGSTTSSGGSTSGGGTSSSGGASTCPVRYCCNFDGDECAVDRPDIQAYAVNPEWLSQTVSVSPPGSMKLEVQGFNAVLDMGLSMAPKQATGKRVEVKFSLRMETTAIAGVLLAKGGGGAFALVSEGTSLWIYDGGKFNVGAITPNAWNAVTLVIDIPAQTYGASVGGAAAVTRNMSDNNAAVFPDVTELRVGLTRANGTTTAYYDDVRVDWN